MKNESEPRAWRSQRGYGLPVKLAVVGEVGRGEWSYTQAPRRYATHFVTFQAGGPASPIASPAMDPTPEQGIYLYGVSRQGLYQRRQRQAGAARRAEQVLVQAVRTRLLRVGTRKLRQKIAPLLRVQGVACGRDALFILLRHRGLLVVPKRSYTKTTNAHHRFHPNLVKEAPKPMAPN